MKQLIRPIPLLLIAALAAAPATLDAAGQRGFGHGPHTGAFGSGGFLGERIADRLDLSDEQREQIRAVRESYSEETRLLVETLATERRALGDAIRADVLDEGLIREAAARVALIEADLAVQRARIGGDVRQVLTPDQFEQAQEMREMFHGFAEKMRGRWGRGPGLSAPSDSLSD